MIFAIDYPHVGRAAKSKTDAVDWMRWWCSVDKRLSKIERYLPHLLNLYKIYKDFGGKLLFLHRLLWSRLLVGGSACMRVSRALEWFLLKTKQTRHVSRFYSTTQING